MQEQVIELKNYDAQISKNIWMDDGTRETLGPLERRRLPYPVARKFLEQHPNHVREYEEKQLPLPQTGEKIKYIANVTGSCLLPKEVSVIQMVNNQKVEKVIPNPLLKEEVLRFKMLGNQTIFGPDNNRQSRMEPPVVVTLEPLTRYPLPAGYANTILTRVGRSPETRKGAVVECAEPGDCEPNETWDLDDIRLFAFMVDEVRFSDRRLRDEYPPKKKFLVEEGVYDDDGIRETKKLLLKELFPLVIDSRYSKPPRAVFEAARNKRRELERATDVEEESAA